MECRGVDEQKWGEWEVIWQKKSKEMGQKRKEGKKEKWRSKEREGLETGKDRERERGREESKRGCHSLKPGM